MAMTVVLDTNIILYHLGGQLVSEIPPASFFVSAISEIELLSYHSLSPEEESTLRKFLDDTTIVDLDVAVKRRAIEVRREYRLKIPDAIVAATALVIDAELISNDPIFRRIQNLRCKSMETT